MNNRNRIAALVATAFRFASALPVSAQKLDAISLTTAGLAFAQRLGERNDRYDQPQQQVTLFISGKYFASLTRRDPRAALACRRARVAQRRDRHQRAIFADMAAPFASAQTAFTCTRSEFAGARRALSVRSKNFAGHFLYRHPGSPANLLAFFTGDL